MGASFFKNWVQENDVTTLAKRRKYLYHFGKKLFTKNIGFINILLSLLPQVNLVGKDSKGSLGFLLVAWEVLQDTEPQGQGHKTGVVTGPGGQFHPRVPTEVKTPTDPLDPLGVGANLV